MSPSRESVRRIAAHRRIAVLLVGAVLSSLPALARAAAPMSAQGAIVVGSEVTVTGTGNCLNVHVGGLDSDVIDCLPDGTRARTVSGPYRQGDYNMWNLLGHGWVVDRWLVATAPPEPELTQAATPRPNVSGLIAYVAHDNNLRVTNVSGDFEVALTSDARAIADGYLARYEGLQWSPQGRYLAAIRHSPVRPPGLAGDDRRLTIYDVLRNTLRFIVAPEGRAYEAFYWFDERHVLVAEVSAQLSGCDNRTFGGQSIQLLDVVTGAHELVAPQSSNTVSIARLGPLSPSGASVVYEEWRYCEGPWTLCAVAVASRSWRCSGEGFFALLGWIGDHELLMRENNPYQGDHRLAPLVFDTTSGGTHIASPTEQNAIVGELSAHGQLHRRPEDTRDIMLGNREILHVPAQQSARIPAQALSPDGKAFLFLRYDPSSRIEPAFTTWIALTDGTGEVWRTDVVAKTVAWQPAIRQRNFVLVWLAEFSDWYARAIVITSKAGQ